MSTKRLDFLRDIEHRIQKEWEDEKIYEVEADEKNSDTFFVTFPYPYMNGRLHLGHAFSLTKSEFSARYQRLNGKHVLWTLGFHGTGMPIAAAADRIKNELAGISSGSGGSMASHAKIAAKTGDAKTQTAILESLGVPVEDIPKFADPRHWLKYFTPLGASDLKEFGVGADWRRSFMTTDINPYYDAFVRWQFRTLYKRNRLKFGLRPCIFSPIDEQPCADHDRASGEALNPKPIMTLVCETEDGSKVLAACDNPSEVHQNVLVNPEAEYGYYAGFSHQMQPEDLATHAADQLINGVSILSCDAPAIYICTPAVASNLVFQGLLQGDKQYHPVHHKIVKGSELIGLKIKVPTSPEQGEIVGSATLKTEDQLGVVLAVPPHLKKKTTEEETPAYDFSNLQAKHQAVHVHIPEGRIVARSGCVCVVALCNQWYSDFGNPEWTQTVVDHITNNFNAYGQTHTYLRTAKWLEGWACSRSYGLGTYLPWEEERGNKIVIESLSDSTIYFAYYTIAHMLHSDFFGQVPGTLNIQASQLNDHIFDYIYCQTDTLPTEDQRNGVSEENLVTMRKAFEYWYPMTLRCSGKDLVPNHLTMSLFHHVAIWPHRPDLWPKGFYVNGFVLLDSNKMSKSTGNFLTLLDACSQFSTDATRIALADSGDSCDDANFERSTALSALMRLYNLVTFADEIKQKTLRKEFKTADGMFMAQTAYLVNQARNAYDQMLMRDALKATFFEMLNLKDTYRNILDPTDELNEEAIRFWLRHVAIVLSPIAPHVCEYLWRYSLGNSTSFVVQQRFEVNELQQDKFLIDQYKFRTLQQVVTDIRASIEKAAKSSKKKGGAAGDVKAKTSVEINVATSYKPLQAAVLPVLRRIEFDRVSLTPVDMKGWIDVVKSDPEIQKLTVDKKAMAEVMAFASYKVKRVAQDGLLSLEDRLPFDEAEFLSEHSGYIARSLGLESVSVVTGSTGMLGCPTFSLQ